MTSMEMKPAARAPRGRKQPLVTVGILPTTTLVLVVSAVAPPDSSLLA